MYCIQIFSNKLDSNQETSFYYIMSVILLYNQSHFTGCCYTECHHTDYYCSEWHYTDRHYTEFHYTECHYREYAYHYCVKCSYADYLIITMLYIVTLFTIILSAIILIVIILNVLAPLLDGIYWHLMASREFELSTVHLSFFATTMSRRIKQIWITSIRESLSKRKAHYNWSPCTN